MTPDELARACADVMWSGDAASQGLGLRLESVASGTAEVSMLVRDDMTNGHGIGHGGFIFTLADSAFAFACNSHNIRCVAQACDIVFVLPTFAGDRLVAHAVERLMSGRTGIYDVTVTRDDEVVAEFRGRSHTIGGVHVDLADDATPTETADLR